MISEDNVKYFVREGEMKKIENYDKAIADKTQTWHCHHRLEFTLDGEFAHSKEELKRLGMYFNRPYFELIFLTPVEHKRLHNKAQSEAQLEKMRKALKGKSFSGEHKKKISEALKNKPISGSDFGVKYFEHYGYSNAANPKQYQEEYRWYRKHNNKFSWE